MRADDHLAAAEDYDDAAQATEETVLRSIYRNLAELHRRLHLAMHQLAEWHRQNPLHASQKAKQ
jgi:hypothetical protein